MFTTGTAAVPTATTSAGTARRPVWRAGLVAAAGASIATTVLAAVASAAGVTFADRTGASIPLAGFAQLTFLFSMIGVALASVLARRARRPRSTFVRTTVALTLLSFVPDVSVGFAASSAVTLMLLHVVAAVIVVPTLASRLATRR